MEPKEQMALSASPFLKEAKNRKLYFIPNLKSINKIFNHEIEGPFPGAAPVSFLF
jgi:hypothetical protein